MEGLLLAAALSRLAPLLPAERRAWRFLDATTFVLPLHGGPALWLWNRPPEPRLELRDDVPEGTRTFSAFQEQLLARVAGPLERAEQHKLDRVVRLHFGATEGFVPGEATTLVFELTGRNCNLILVRDATVVGAAREVGADINRFRQVRSGLAYVPPPPYDKLDPRTVAPDILRETLRGRTLSRVKSLVDGIGPTLSRALAVHGDLDRGTVLQGAALERAVSAIGDLVADPERVLAASLDVADLTETRAQQRRAALQGRLGAALARELRMLDKRLGDADRTVRAAERSDELRRRADLLMSFPHHVPAKATRVTLDDFDGNPVDIELDPALDAIHNAQRLYEQAKRRERRARDAAGRSADLSAKRAAVEAATAALDGADEPALLALIERYAPEPVRAERARGPGLRFQGPHGFEVVVGRSAAENDEITFRLGRSLDLWLHAQGYPGSHVLVRSNGSEVPFDTVLFAARLAAGHSKAGQGDNVPVDYTLRKHVWKAKGMAPGAVYITQQKTVYVTPSRRADAPTANGRG